MSHCPCLRGKLLSDGMINKDNRKAGKKVKQRTRTGYSQVLIPTTAAPLKDPTPLGPRHRIWGECWPEQFISWGNELHKRLHLQALRHCYLGTRINLQMHRIELRVQKETPVPMLNWFWTRLPMQLNRRELHFKQMMLRHVDGHMQKNLHCIKKLTINGSVKMILSKSNSRKKYMNWISPKL